MTTNLPPTIASDMPPSLKGLLAAVAVFMIRSIFIRMKLDRELAIGALYLFRRGTSRHIQDFIVIALLGRHLLDPGLIEAERGNQGSSSCSCSNAPPWGLKKGRSRAGARLREFKPRGHSRQPRWRGEGVGPSSGSPGAFAG